MYGRHRYFEEAQLVWKMWWWHDEWVISMILHAFNIVACGCMYLYHHKFSTRDDIDTILSLVLYSPKPCIVYCNYAMLYQIKRWSPVLLDPRWVQFSWWSRGQTVCNTSRPACLFSQAFHRRPLRTPPIPCECLMPATRRLLYAEAEGRIRAALCPLRCRLASSITISFTVSLINRVSC